MTADPAVPEGYVYVNRGWCRGCGAPILWARVLATGRSAPFDLDGVVSHFATCPQADRFRARRHPSPAIGER